MGFRGNGEGSSPSIPGDDVLGILQKIELNTGNVLSGTLYGVVTDENGDKIQNVKVTVEVDDDWHISVKTGFTGGYMIPAVPIGANYRVRFEKDEFIKAEYPIPSILRNQNLTQDHPIKAVIPPGTVTAFSGPADSVPEGWAVCDGTNGTPDLRDRFIIGAGTTYTVGTKGGTNVNVNGFAHTHAVAHTHTVSGVTGDVTSGAAFIKTGSNSTSNDFTPDSHTHTFSGTLTAPAAINMTAAPGPDIDNKPPFYALTYIVKKKNKIN